MGSAFCLCCLVVVPVVAPSDIGGGGGTSRELTITWTVGLDFPLGSEGWSGYGGASFVAYLNEMCCSAGTVRTVCSVGQ